MTTVLRQRNYFLLWSGGLISTIGSWVLRIALPFYVYEKTGSPLATGAVFAAEAVPWVLFNSIVGVFVDRWDRQRTIIYVSLMQALLTFLLLLVSSGDWLWLLYLIIFLRTTVGLFGGPVQNALIPRLVRQEQLMVANSLDAVAEKVARLVGPALGGTLLGLMGLTSVVLVDGLSFVIAASLIWLIRVPFTSPETDRTQTNMKPKDEPVAAESVQRQWQRFWEEWRSGLQLVKSDYVLMTCFFNIAIIGLAGGIIGVVEVAFVQDVLALGSLEYGWILSTRGLGGIMAGLLIGQLGRATSSAHLLGWGVLIEGIIWLMFFNSRLLPLILGLSVILALATVVWEVSTRTLFQVRVSEDYLGRVFSAYGTTMALMFLLGTGTAGLFGYLLDTISLLNLSGSLVLIAGVVALVRMRRVSRVMLRKF